MNLFSATLRLTGLSDSEASEWLSATLDKNVSARTLGKMKNGSTWVYEDVWDALNFLVDQIEDASEILIENNCPEDCLYESADALFDWPSARCVENVVVMTLSKLRLTP